MKQDILLILLYIFTVLFSTILNPHVSLGTSFIQNTRYEITYTLLIVINIAGMYAIKQGNYGKISLTDITTTAFSIVLISVIVFITALILSIYKKDNTYLIYTGIIPNIVFYSSLLLV